MKRKTHIFASAALLTLLLIPSGASAASARPSCELTVTTKNGEASITKSGTVLVGNGDEFSIEWESNNAKKAELNGQSIDLKGEKELSVTKSTDYEFTFTAGSRKTTCELEVRVAEGSFTKSTLSSESSRPKLSGTASGVKQVRVAIYKEGSSKMLTSKVAKVRNGKWNASVSKKLPDGSYDVKLIGDKKAELAVLDTGTLTIGEGSVSGDTTLSVSFIPLLTGGTVKAGGIVPVSYLKVTNTGKEAASVKGFWVKQNGSANTAAIVQLTTVDDKGGSRGASTVTPFKNGSAYAPTNTIIAPGETRLYTIKAVMQGNVSAYIGRTLMLDVTGIDSTADTRSTFPIKGTTWTIGY